MTTASKTTEAGARAQTRAKAERPRDCECDNTHEQNRTCCMPCWNAGFRAVNENEEVDIAKPIQRLAHMILVRGKDGREWFVPISGLAAIAKAEGRAQ